MLPALPLSRATCRAYFFHHSSSFVVVMNCIQMALTGIYSSTCMLARELDAAIVCELPMSTAACMHGVIVITNAIAV